MDRIVTIYNAEGVAIGPSPNTGFNFMTYLGEMNNNTDDYPNNNDLLLDLGRVQSVSYSIGLNRENIRQLGERSVVKRIVLNHPTVDISIDYLLAGLKNEARIGLNVNYPKQEYPDVNAPFYEDNFNVWLLRGLDGRTLEMQSHEPYLPHLDYRDRKNIYVGIGPKGQDLVDIGPDDMEVVGFGNCYLSSYNLRAAVGEIPAANANFIGENIEFYKHGSGQGSPTVRPKDRISLDNLKFNMPDFYNLDGFDISVLRPGNIVMSISGLGFEKIEDLGTNLSMSQIQSVSLGIDLEREPLDRISYKLPIDRQINLPAFATVNVVAIVSETESGSVLDIINENKEYDVTVRMYDPCSSGAVVRYDVRGAKLETLSYNESIGDFRSVNMGFSVEMDPSLSRGLFMSGDLKIEKPFNYLIGPSGNFITDINGNRVITDKPPLFA